MPRAGNLRILIGADPEVFVKNDKNIFVSGHGLIPGTKKEPFKVPLGAVQVDGMALEFNTQPAGNAEDFVDTVFSVKTHLGNMVKGKGFTIVEEPVAIFDKEVFDSTPPEAKVLGCDPDFNAWTGERNNPPDNLTTMRTAAGHIHIGWGKGFNVEDDCHIEDCRALVKQMDYYLGLYSLWWDEDDKRRAMYGQAGAFRPKPYGVEYRVLSNVWLRDREITRWIWEAAYRGTRELLGGKSMPEKFGEFARDMIAANNKYWTQDTHGQGVMMSMGMNGPRSISMPKR
jgi:hypothetical protein